MSPARTPCRIALPAGLGNPRKLSWRGGPNRDDIRGSAMKNVHSYPGSFRRLRSALRAKKKCLIPGWGNEAKNLFHELHVPREPGGNWQLASRLKPLIRLSCRHRARNPSATLHEDRCTPFRGVTPVS